MNATTLIITAYFKITVACKDGPYYNYLLEGFLGDNRIHHLIAYQSDKDLNLLEKSEKLFYIEANCEQIQEVDRNIKDYDVFYRSYICNAEKVQEVKE